MDNTFRHISKSETNIADYEYTDILVFTIENKETMFEKIKKNKYVNLIIKKLLIFLIHLNLIALFETLFFIFIVSKHEETAIYNVINSYSDNIMMLCDNLNITEKIYISKLFNYTNEYNHLKNISNISYNNRAVHNNNLFNLAWVYFFIVLSINCFLLFIKCIFKLKIKIKKIVCDNLIMILILAIYEYLFFKNIISNYNNISKNELSRNIFDQFNQCFIWPN
jgi:hypothetical protein